MQTTRATTDDEESHPGGRIRHVPQLFRLQGCGKSLGSTPIFDSSRDKAATKFSSPGLSQLSSHWAIAGGGGGFRGKAHASRVWTAVGEPAP